MMKFGLKVHHSDLDSLMYIGPEALEFVIHAEDLDGTLIDLGTLDESERKKAVDIVKRSIDLAERLKAGVLVCHPGGVYKEHRELSHSGLVYSMRQLKAYAGDRVDVLMENMPDVYWYNGELWATCLFKDWKEIRDVLHETGMRLCLDLSHARLYCNSRHIDLNLYVTVLKPYIGHLHISDALGVSSEGLQIGDGETNFKSLLKILDGLDVILVPEIVDGHKNNGAGFKMAKKRLSRLGYIKKDE